MGLEQAPAPVPTKPSQGGCGLPPLPGSCSPLLGLGGAEERRERRWVCGTRGRRTWFKSPVCPLLTRCGLCAAVWKLAGHCLHKFRATSCPRNPSPGRTERTENRDSNRYSLRRTHSSVIHNGVNAETTRPSIRGSADPQIVVGPCNRMSFSHKKW